MSELVTNAVLHSASGQIGGAFIVRIEVTEAAIQLSVSDQGPALVPARRTPDESGRGLDLVAALADAYDVIDAPIGRTVRCRLTAERR
ncbi:ATP-binding protein [Streptosporangium lutulentum]